MSLVTPTFRKISSVFLAEFDNVAGPRNSICVQPQSAQPLPAEVFDQVYEFLIPKRSLYGQIVSVQIDSFSFIGKPTQVQGSQYKRNAYLFNIGFVLESSPEQHPFIIRDMSPVVLKLSDELLSLEQERGLLSRQDWQSKTTLRTKLTKMVNQLYEKGSHFLVFDASHAVYLKVLSCALKYNPKACSIPHIGQRLRLDHVPVAIRPPMSVRQFASHVDPFTRNISLHINGVYCIDQIASLTRLEREIVFRSIRLLLDAGMIRCIDLFRFQNKYEPTNKLQLVKDDVSFWEQCHRLVSNYSKRTKDLTRQKDLRRVPSGERWLESVPERSLSFGDTHSRSCRMKTSSDIHHQYHPIVKYDYLYHSLHRRETVEQFVESHKEELETIDIRKWIAFGVLTGIIHRIYEYPICIRESCLPSIASSLERQVETDHRSGVQIDTARLRELLNGRHCTDELGCLLNVSLRTLETILYKYSKDIQIWWIGEGQE